MTYYRDLREYLDLLESEGKLNRIKQRINRDTELHPLVRWQFRGLDEVDRRGFLFERLTDLTGREYQARVACSITAPSRAVYAMGLGCSVEELDDRWRGAIEHPIQPRLVETGPVKEVVHVGTSLLEHGGLAEFPIPITTNGWEGLPRLTALSWVSRDPDSGELNVGTYNGLLLGPLRTNLRASHSKGMVQHWKAAKQRGEPLKIAAVVGAVPAVTMASVADLPLDVDELAVAGGLAREPIPVVRCETSDLVVPAAAEIIIEGEIPTDYMEPDGASGEHTGYTLLTGSVYSFRVTCITHRKNPIWHDIICGMPPTEDCTIRALSNEGLFLTHLRDTMGVRSVRQVSFHHAGAANRLCVIQMGTENGVQPSAETVSAALNGALALHPYWPKIVIAVDEDIDPSDLESVVWAVSFRYQPHRDTRIVEGRQPSHDQSARPWSDSEEGSAWDRADLLNASAILIDACRKWAYTPVSLPKRPYMDRARALWEELNLPPLRPRAPWYGANLGNWPEACERQALAAEKGEYGLVAEELTKGGFPV